MMVQTIRERMRQMKRKVTVSFFRRPYAGQLCVKVHGWPFNSGQWNTEDRPVALDANQFRKPSAIKLNVGGGKGHPEVEGWTVADLRRKADLHLDITKTKLPYEDDAVSVIFTSHTLEHIYPQQLGFVLSEFYRVLKSGSGLLRIGVPDIALAARAYMSQDYGFFKTSEVSVFDKDAPIGGLLASWFYSTRVFADSELKHGEGHVHCFDYEYLVFWLRKTGFRRVWRSAYRQSILPELREEAFDRHPNDTLFVEALK